jgi:hypothetical protein
VGRLKVHPDRTDRAEVPAPLDAVAAGGGATRRHPGPLALLRDPVGTERRRPAKDGAA